MLPARLTALEINGLRQALSTFYTDKNEQHLSQIFTIFDRNHDGKISRAELVLVMKSVQRGLADSAVEQMMDEADSNGDGFIDLREFSEVIKRHSE